MKLDKLLKNKMSGKFFIFAGFLLACLIAIYPLAQALPVSAQTAPTASLKFIPSEASLDVGKTIVINVFISSPAQAMNATSGVISVPLDYFDVDNISRSGSIITAWLTEPTLNLSTGLISFDGIIVNPGYQGSAGKFFTITLKAKKIGIATLSFTKASILANDGKGTEINSGLATANFVINEAAPVVPVVPVVPVGPTPVPTPTPTPTPPPTPTVPSAPIIRAPDEPDQSAWYSGSSAIFQWNVPADATGVSFAFNSSSGTIPPTRSAGIISSKSYANLADGVYYFHLRLQNKVGWSSTSHFKIQLDKSKPEPLTLVVTEGEVTDNPQPHISFGTTDTPSGIDYYLITVKGNGNNFELIKQVNDISFILPKLSPGEYSILLEAFDRAGNTVQDSKNLTILQIPKPEITQYPTSLLYGQTLVITGTALPRSKLIMKITDKNGVSEEQTVVIGEERIFVAVWPKVLPVGNYTLSARQVNLVGAESFETSPVSFDVARSVILFQIGSISVDAVMLSIIVSIFGLLLATIMIYEYAFFYRRRNYLVSLLTKSYHGVHTEFLKLRQEADTIPVSQLNDIEMIKEDLEKTEDKIEAQLAVITKKARK